MPTGPPSNGDPRALPGDTGWGEAQSSAVKATLQRERSSASSEP
jgi:hypothetical protein